MNHWWKSYLIFSSLAIMIPALAQQAMPRFENAAGRAGLDFSLLSGSPAKQHLPESMSGGVGFIDYDNDGWLDVYLVNGSTLEAVREGRPAPGNRLFRNNGDGAFTDVTGEAGVGDGGWGMGVCIGDVNNDGWDDIYVTNIGANVLYLNNGDGTFRDFSRESGTDDPSWSSSAAFADYDGDGNLDLYVSNYVEFDANALPFHGMRIPQGTLECRYRGISVQCGPRGLKAQADRFYRNTGNGVFVDWTEKAGIAQPRSYYGLGVIWGDYNDDGHPDIFVANDSTPNFLFQNNGDGTFTELGLTSGVAYSADGKEQACMGVDFADYDNDGRLDIFVTNFSDDTNTLYRNLGDGRFADVTYTAGLGSLSWQLLGWGAWFVDVDLDGWKDLAFVNGHVYPEVDDYEIGTSLRQLNSLFRNQGDGTFRDATGSAGPGFQEVRNSRGLAVGDINNDGQMDLLISNLEESPTLLVSRSAPLGNWILLKLKGTVSNRSAIGARVYVQTGELRQMSEVRSGGSYQSQSDLRLHFGLGDSRRIDRIEIHWPSGIRQELRNLEANRVLTIVEEAPAAGAGLQTP